MWNIQEYEKHMSEKLKMRYGNDRGDKIFSDYTYARNKLIDDNFFSQIQGKEPNLTDHSERHIANVLENAFKLLGDDIVKLSAIELYSLGLIILFHDVGNINGREKHNKNIAEVYDFVRSRESKFNREKAIVIKAGEAHCGKSKDSSKDTLKDLEITDSLNGEPVQLRSLAAILRLADELAEGNQRTSQFMFDRHKYDPKSEIYHNYARITHILIDRPGGRILITYDIDFDTKKMSQKDLTELLEFTYKRMIKLDEERRYNKHYCDLLSPFKKTSIQFNLTVDGIPANLDLGKIELDDRFPIPGEGDDDKSISELLSNFPDIKADEIWKQINSSNDR